MRRGSSPRSGRRSGPAARPTAPCAWSAPLACARGRPSARSPDARLERFAQSARGGRGILGVADRAHDNHPRARRRRRPRRRSRRRCLRSRTRGSSPRSAAYSISSSPVPGRPSLVGVAHTGPTLIWSGRSGPVAAQAAWICSREWVESPTSASGPANRRASATGRSSWPTWTPSASQAATRSGRSLRMNSARCSVAARRNGSASAISSWAEHGDFSRSWMHVRAAPQGRVEKRTRIAAQRKALADEVEARRLQGPEPLIAVGGHRAQYRAATGVPWNDNGSPVSWG